MFFVVDFFFFAKFIRSTRHKSNNSFFNYCCLRSCKENDHEKESINFLFNGDDDYSLFFLFCFAIQYARIVASVVWVACCLHDLLGKCEL